MNLRLVGALFMLFFVCSAAQVFPASTATYHVHGILRSVDSSSHELTISHEAIPGYMGAMTMKFRVLHEAELRDLRPGEGVSFDLRVQAEDAWIEDVKKESSTAWPFKVEETSHGVELKPGDEWPDAKLTDEEGGTTYLHEFRGRVLAITFIYLGCPLPTYCPLMNRNFQTAQALIQRLDYGDQMRLLSLSMDAASDTPDRLSAVASGYEAKQSLWTFASVTEDQLRPLAEAAGLQFAKTDGQIVHNLRTVILDRDGRLRCVLRGNSWTAQQLVAELRLALEGAH